MSWIKYKSDNTRYPDPHNFIEYLILKWNNLWDKEYQESKKRYERLRHYEDLKISKSEKAKSFLAMKKQARNAKR
jgi:hypothetical protein